MSNTGNQFRLIDRGSGAWSAILKRKAGSLAVRVITEQGGYRIDFTKSVGAAWQPWEPIATTVFSTFDEAEKALRSSVTGLL